MTKIEDGIKALDPEDPVDVGNAARLHAELLPGSPVPQLGEAFVRQFYYRKLVEDSLVRCDLYYDNGTAVGFIAYTKHSEDFMTRGLRRHFLYLSALMVGTVIRDPSRIRVMLSLLKVARTRKSRKSNAALGELLSLGVLPEYCNSHYVRRTGHRISLELVEHAKRYFLAERVPGFRGMVGARDRATLLFYHALGCQLQKNPAGRGDTVQVTYNFEEMNQRATA